MTRMINKFRASAKVTSSAAGRRQFPGRALKVFAAAGVILQLSGCFGADDGIAVCNDETDLMHFAAHSNPGDETVNLAVVCGAGGAYTSGGHVEIWKIAEGTAPKAELIKRIDDVDNPGFAAFGDLDADGDADLIVVNLRQGSSSVSAFENTDGVIGDRTIVLHDFRGPGGRDGLLLHDADANGTMDVLLPARDRNSTASILRTGAADKIGPFMKMDFFVDRQPVNGVISDINGDGVSDFVEIAAKYGAVRSFLGQSSEIIDYPFGKAARAIETVVAGGDVDGDGQDEMFLTVRVDAYTAAVHLAKSNGEDWSISEALADANNPKIAFVAQMDDDPAAEFVALSFVDIDADHYLARVYDFVTSGRLEQSGAIDIGTYPSQLFIGDLRGDAKAEIIWSSQEDRTITLSDW